MNQFCKQFNLNEQLALIINIISNIDKMSVVQMTLSQAGVYKYLLWTILAILLIIGGIRVTRST